MAASAAIDRDHPAVQLLAGEVRRACDIDTMRVAYDIVRDRYPHSMDIHAPAVSVSASDVLRHGHGICFAKSHLLAAVLRTCGIATGVDAKFSVGIEYLAFPIRLDRGECDFAEIHARPLPSTLAALRSSRTTVELARRLPEDMSAADRLQAEEACFRLEHLWPSFDSITR
jgi:transglutaminase-like putative cysteine protease